MDRGERAITPALYRFALSENDLSAREWGVIPRLITGLYVTHYATTFDAIIPSGAVDVEVNDLENGYPNVDLDLLRYVLNGLGLYKQNFRANKNYEAEIARSYLSCDHISISNLISMIVAAADSLCKPDVPRFSRRSQVKAILSPYFAARNVGEQTDGISNFLSMARLALERIAANLFENNPGLGDMFNLTRGEFKMQRKFLIHTATDREDDALRSCLKGRHVPVTAHHTFGGFIVSEYAFASNVDVFHVRTSMGIIGPSSAGHAVQAVVSKFRPDHIISAGICFGMREGDQALGDIVFSEEIQDYLTGKETESGFEDRGSRVPVDGFLLSLARAARAGFNYSKSHGGLYISGPQVINSLEKVKEILSRFPDAKAGDMEASAVFGAATVSKLGMITVKGICDWGYGKNDRYQVLAAENAFHFVMQMLELANGLQNVEARKIG